MKPTVASQKIISQIADVKTPEQLLNIVEETISADNFKKHEKLSYVAATCLKNDKLYSTKLASTLLEQHIPIDVKQLTSRNEVFLVYQLLLTRVDVTETELVYILRWLLQSVTDTDCG